MTELDGEIAANAQRHYRRSLWQAARRYRRAAAWLDDLLPPDFLTLALQDAASPAVTWQVIRHLCRHIRFNARSPLGRPQRVKRCRTALAGELLLLQRQRAAARERRFVGGILSDICQAM